MADFWFVVRSFLVTLAIILLLQIKVGSRTIEQYSIAWVHTSAVGETLHSVAYGAARVTRMGVEKVNGWFGHSNHSSRHEARRIERSSDSDSNNSIDEREQRSLFEVKTVHEPIAD